MGVQITVDKDDLLEAGWAISYESDEMPDPGRLLVARKVVDGQSFCFISYVKDALCVDCNAWGNNAEQLWRSGLSSVPHVVA